MRYRSEFSAATGDIALLNHHVALAEAPPDAAAGPPCGNDAPPAVNAIDEDDDEDVEDLPVEELPGALDPVDDFDEDDFDDDFDDDFEEELDEDEELDEEVTEADLNSDEPEDAEFDDE